MSDKDFIILECGQDQVDDLLGFVIDAFKGSGSLIILHDCASIQNVKNRTSNLVKLEFSGRHY